MDYEKLRSAAEAITIPEEAKYRIVRNCKTQLSNARKEIIMNPNKTNALFKKPAAVFVAVVLCLSLSVAGLAAAGVLQGFFQDVTDSRGAVVGTTYESASDEISISATANGNELTILAAFADPQAAPYADIERLGIAAYRIVDAGGNAVKEGSAEAVEVVDGLADIRIDLGSLDGGSYTLSVTAFVSEKTADQPLTINGSWECSFTK